MIRLISGFILSLSTFVWLSFVGCSPKNTVETPPDRTVELPGVVTLSQQVILGLKSIRIYNGQSSAEGFQFFEFEGDEIRIDVVNGNVYISPPQGQESLKGCFTQSQLQQFDEILRGLRLCEFPGAYGQKENPICTMAVVPPWITLRYEDRIQSLGGSNDGCRKRVDFCDSETFKSFLDSFESSFSAANQSCS